MLEGYDRLIVAATPQKLEVGQGFTVLPPHLRLFGWMELPESFTPRLKNIVELTFRDEDTLQNARFGFRSWRYRDERARVVKNVDKKQWYAIDALRRSFPQSDDVQSVSLSEEQPRFVPMGYELPPRRASLELASVALFSTRGDAEHPVIVEAVQHLGAFRDQETA